MENVDLGAKVRESFIKARAEWGKPIESNSGLDDLAYWTHNAIRDSLIAVKVWNCDMNMDMWTVIRCFAPRPAVNDASKISIYANESDHSRNRRLVIKPGRFFRRIAPALPDAIIEKLVDRYRREKVTAELTLKESESADDFQHAYTGDAMQQHNLSASGAKSLALSCMRHDSFRIHPSRAYASGDFKIAWLENAESQIAARVTIQHKKQGAELDSPIAAPVYAATDEAAKMLISYCESIGAVFNRPHKGARLAAIRIGNGFVMPYVDNGPSYCRESSNSRYLILTDNGNFSTRETSGYVSDGPEVTCDDCGAYVHEDDSFSSDSGHTFCETCYNERFVSCDRCGDTVSREDLTEVFQWQFHYRRRESIHVCETCRDDHYSETDSGEYWKIEDCELITTPSGDELCIDPITLEREYIYCEETDSYFHFSSMAIVRYGDRNIVIPRKQVSPDYWTISDGGIATLTQPLLDLGVCEIPGIVKPEVDDSNCEESELTEYNEGFESLEEIQARPTNWVPTPPNSFRLSMRAA